nr:hypothetical protein [Psychrobacter sp. WY6]
MPSTVIDQYATALSAVLASSLNVDSTAIEQALQTVRLAGRFDYREIHNRHWLFDVAHNEQGVEFLLAQLLPLWQQHLANQNSFDALNQSSNPNSKYQ